LDSPHLPRTLALDLRGNRLDRNLKGWLRQRFGELGVLEYEDLEDTGTEYEALQLA